MKKLFVFLLAAMLAAFVSHAGDKTYYSKLTATAPSGEGKVYVSTTSTDNPVYEATSSASQSSASQNHSYYLYAQPREGKILDGWYSGESLLSADNPYSYSFESSSTTESSPTTAELTARFKDRTVAVMVSTSDSNIGTATISKTENTIGDELTVKATLTKVPRYGCRNLTTEFTGWRDKSTGEIVSTEAEYTFTAIREMDLEAMFRTRNALKEKGYFRVRNIFDRVLSIEGNYKYVPVGSTQNYLDGLLRFACPDDLVEADFANKKWNGSDDDPRVDVESMPSTVIYISGENLDLTAGPNGDALKNVNAFGQGAETYAMTGYKLTIKPAMAECAGYYILYGGALDGGLKMTHREADEDRDGDGVNDGHYMYCSTLLGRCKYDDPYSWMAVQPIDEEHMDEFWFGAAADESMFFDGAYWTTMYTGFPYECRDGVEAYYANAVAESEGVSYIRIEKIESGIVPAYTPVILKCQGTTSKQNRLLPLDPEASYTPVEGNMLAGEFQLYTDKNLNGRKLYDSETMRVFGVNSSGEVGFYRLAAKPDGSARELAANRAYLDLTKLPASAQGVRSFRIIDGDNTNLSGIDVLEDPNDASMPEEYYTLEGIRVNTPVRGNLYIVRQGRSAKKIIY